MISLDSIKKDVLKESKAVENKLEIVEIREDNNTYMFMLHKFNENGFLESFIPQPIYCVKKQDGLITKKYLIKNDDIVLFWEKSNIIYKRRKTLEEVLNEIKASSNYKLYKVLKIYRSEKYYKFYLKEELFKINMIVIYDILKNEFIEINNENKYLIENEIFEEIT